MLSATLELELNKLIALAFDNFLRPVDGFDPVRLPFP